MAQPHKHDLVVIGAGPGGYVAAIRAAQLGLSVGVADENTALGGTCLRVGCIPSKALLESSERFEHAQHHLATHGIKTGKLGLDLPAMLARKDKVVKQLVGGVAALFKKNKITHYPGRGRLTDHRAVRVERKDHDPVTLEARHVILATGSVPAELPGVTFDTPGVDSSTDALAYDKVPNRLVVIGAGYIGIELGSVWRRLGAEVTVLEYLDRILPGMDDEIAAEAHKLFAKQGLTFQLGARVTGVSKSGKALSVEVEGHDPVPADRVLLAVGRKPNTRGLGLEDAGVRTDDRGRITVDEDYRTSAEGVYAIGDVIPGPMLAHKAEEEGVACVEKIVHGFGHVDYNAIPGVVYTHPEIASVGRTEQQLAEAEVPYKKGVFPFAANGRAIAIAESVGRVKVLAHAETDRVLGVHILGPRAGDLIAECATAMTLGASSEDIARACHAHPTLAEAVKEAALNVTTGAIHV